MRPRLAAMALLALAGCTGDPASFSRDAALLPATLQEAYRIAEGIALEWSPNAFPTDLGGGFTVMDAGGAARNHTFEFHARDRFTHRRLQLHLFSGTPWMAETIVPAPPPKFVELADMVDSDVVVAIAINVAEAANAVTADSIPVTEEFAARLSSRAVYPEPDGKVVPEQVAWRVDFLMLDVSEVTEVPVYWSTARFYLDPYSGELLGDPVLPPAGREIYPFP